MPTKYTRRRLPVVFLAVFAAIALSGAAPPALAQDKALSERAKGLDANSNGVIDRDEARGPLAENFDEMDCDKSSSLDGAEIRGFFSGQGCPEAPPAVTQAATASTPAPDKALSERAKGMDANNNGVIDRDEARGPLAENFDEMDCDKSGSLDGAEIRGFFSGQGCPEAPPAATASTSPPGPSARAGGGQRRSGRPPRSVRVDKVIKEMLSQTFPVIGRLVARRTGAVAARINGAVVTMNVDVGDRVRKGDVIASLALERLTAVRNKFRAARKTRDAMVRTAEAEYSKKSQELRRMGNLRNSSAFSRARYEDLVRDVEGRKSALEERRSLLQEAEAELRRVSIDLENAVIRAPYDGVIVEKHTEIGAYVNTGGRVVSLISDNDIEIEVGVPTDLVAGLSPGLTIRVRLDDGTSHRAVVRAIVPQENPRTRTRPVRLTPDFGNTSKALAANQSITVMVPIGKIRDVVTVHKDAVVHRGNERLVYLARNNRAFRRAVETGEAVGNRYVVLSGVVPGDDVVVQGNEGLPPGAAIRILNNTLDVGAKTQ